MLINKKNFLLEYLKCAPISLALWRATECKALSAFEYRPPILDLGCGDGLFAKILFTDKIDVGVDISKAGIKLAKKHNIHKELRVANAENIPYSNEYFNTILSNCVLEHISNIEPVLKEIYRVLKCGGKFIFTVPSEFYNDFLLIPRFLNKINLSSFANWYIKKINKAFKHFHIYSIAEWEKILKILGFKLTHYKYILPEKSEYIFDTLLIFSLPAYMNKKIFGRWIITPRNFTAKIYNRFLNKFYKSEDKKGGILLIVAEK